MADLVDKNATYHTSKEDLDRYDKKMRGLEEKKTTHEPLQIVPGRSDAETADYLKTRSVKVYGPVLDLVDEAKALGFELNIQSGPGALGKQVITVLRVSKVF